MIEFLYLLKWHLEVLIVGVLSVETTYVEIALYQKMSEWLSINVVDASVRVYGALQ